MVLAEGGKHIQEDRQATDTFQALYEIKNFEVPFSETRPS